MPRPKLIVPRHQVKLYLSASASAVLDQASERSKASRSEIVQQLIEKQVQKLSIEQPQTEPVPRKPKQTVERNRKRGRPKSTSPKLPRPKNPPRPKPKPKTDRGRKRVEKRVFLDTFLDDL